MTVENKAVLRINCHMSFVAIVGPPIPITVDHPRISDYKYIRNIVNIFMMFEPLAARRYAAVIDTRTTIDFARYLQDLSDKYYPHA